MRYILTVLLCLVLFGCQSVGQVKKMSSPENPFFVEYENPDLKLEIWPDKQEYNHGEGVTLYFKANRDCYLMLVDMITNREFSILLPDAIKSERPKDYYRLFPQNGSNFAIIQGGKKYSLSGDYLKAVAEYNGIKTIQAIAVIPDKKLFSTASASFRIIPSDITSRGDEGKNVEDASEPPVPPSTTIAGTLGKDRYDLFKSLGILKE